MPARILSLEGCKLIVPLHFLRHKINPEQFGDPGSHRMSASGAYLVKID
jgi:hypothetical protein